MKQLHLKHKISRPYMCLIIALQLFVIIVFNLLVSTYSYNQAEIQLQKAANNLKRNIDLARDEQPDSTQNLPIHVLLRVMGQPENTQVFIVEDGYLLETPKPGESNLTENVINKAIELTKNASENEIVSFTIQSEYYHAMWLDIEVLPENQSVIYISAGHFADGFVVMVNIILVGISLFVIIISLIISHKISKDIAQPIQEISKTVKKMKTDKLSNLKETQSSLELTELATEINEMNYRIYNYDKQQKMFLHNVSHELKTPLTVIQGFAEGMQQGVFSDSKKTTSILISETERITKILDNILALARIENFDSHYPVEDIDICKYLISNLEFLNGFATKQNKIITANIPDEELVVNANKELLNQSVNNLITNALRHASSVVTLSVLSHENHVIIKVKDDGTGINEKDLPHIFERFYKGKNGNNGLGLSIAKAAAESINAHIKVYNDSGAVFEIYLPFSNIVL